ncbi:glycosyltransferase 87 family protein [Propionicimonas sp.]|uniref:glycosyltransferase 87 family protein n=1 Tax=Propionicimonas sp. TaxID=1955623 RepID=UPI0039E3374D
MPEPGATEARVLRGPARWTGTGRRPLSMPVLLLALLGLGLGILLVAMLVRGLDSSPMPDLQVYRRGVQVWLSGQDLYGFHNTGPDGEVMPFTYPPFAVLVLLPLAWVPDVVANRLWLAMLLALTALLAVVLLRQAPGARRRLSGRALLGGSLVTIALLLSAPVDDGLALGQVSLVITAMALLDAGGILPARWRGVLVGLAGAIKLVPLVFVPYFLITRQWRAARNAAVSFAAATLLAFVVAPRESLLYWTRMVFATGRVGEPEARANKSLTGLLARWDLGGDHRMLAWLLLCAVVAAVALWRARRHHLRGEEFAAALTVGILSVAVSPISWVHHQAWLPLTALYLLLLRRRGPAVAGALLLAAYALGTPFLDWPDLYVLDDPILGEVLSVIPVVVLAVGLPARALPAAGVPTAGVPELSRPPALV